MTIPTDELKFHIVKTYFAMRFGMFITAALLPFLLLAVPGPRRPSISDYYHAAGFGHDIFVGMLFVIGGTLILYRGYTTAENRILNAAGVFLIGVALIPNAGSTCASPVSAGFTLHGFLAFAFFIAIASVMWFYAHKTLDLITDPNRRTLFSRFYRFIAIIMFVLPFWVYIELEMSEVCQSVFFVEAALVWIFAVYWAVKTLELHLTQKDLQVFDITVAKEDP